MNPTTIATFGVAATLLGALIGFSGSYFAARTTARQNRREREQAALGPILRKLNEVNKRVNNTPTDSASAYVQDDVLKDLAVDIEALAFSLPERDRSDIRECVLAIEDRHRYDPRPERVVHRATGTIHAIIMQRANGSTERPWRKIRRPAWVKRTLDGFNEQAALEAENREENDRAMRQYVEEQKDKKTAK